MRNKCHFRVRHKGSGGPHCPSRRFGQGRRIKAAKTISGEPVPRSALTFKKRRNCHDHPGSLAYAKPYEQTHIVVFYDRVPADFRPAGVPSLLGHVLAHEIGHILQGVEHHSSIGVMKEKWDYRDDLGIQLDPLRFTNEDLLLIREGLKNRASTQLRSPGHELPAIGKVGTKITNTGLVPD